jgi:hypothetical protein
MMKIMMMQRTAAAMVGTEMKEGSVEEPVGCSF